MEAGRRLRQTREALGYETGRAFAERTGKDEDALNTYELGKVLVPPIYVAKLNELWGVTHDWIYSGRVLSLPVELVEMLNGKPAAAPVPPREQPDRRRSGERRR